MVELIAFPDFDVEYMASLDFSYKFLTFLYDELNKSPDIVVESTVADHFVFYNLNFDIEKISRRFKAFLEKEVSKEFVDTLLEKYRTLIFFVHAQNEWSAVHKIIFTNDYNHEKIKLLESMDVEQ